MAESPPTARATPGAIALLTSMVMLGQMTISLYIPSLPSLAQSLAAAPEQVKLTMTLYLASFAVAQLFWGPLSDRFGRRPILFAGLGVYLVGTLACALAPGITTLILARGLQGIGACVGSTVSRAITRDRFERNEAARTLAFIGVAMAVGPALAPILGGQLQTLFGWRAAFVALLVFGVCMGIATYLKLDETNKHLDPQATSPVRLLGSFAMLLRSRVYLGYSLAIAGAFTGVMAYVTGSSIAGRLAPRGLGVRLVATGSTICLVCGIAFVAIVLGGYASPVTVVAPMVVFMVGFGILTPNAMAHALQPFPRIAGAASALQGFLQMTVAAIGTVAVAALSDGTPLSTAIGVCAGGIIAAFGFHVLARPAEKHA